MLLQALVVTVACGTFGVLGWYTFTPIVSSLPLLPPWVVITLAVIALPAIYLDAGLALLAFGGIYSLLEDAGMELFSGWNLLRIAFGAPAYGTMLYVAVILALILDGIERAGLLIISAPAFLAMLLTAGFFYIRWVRKNTPPPRAMEEIHL